jgi:2'-5' RNA ligase
VRLFFAIELDDAVRASLDHALAPLRAAEPALAWVRSEKLHLTMKFLGDVEAGDAERLSIAVSEMAVRHRPFELTLGGVGAFPNFRRARVVWMGVASEAKLELLHHDLELACADAGFEVEGRPFRPHITLARVREPLPLDRARPFARAARRVAYAASDEVHGLALLETVHGSTEPGYRRVFAAPLGGC